MKFLVFMLILMSTQFSQGASQKRNNVKVFSSVSCGALVEGIHFRGVHKSFKYCHQPSELGSRYLTHYTTPCIGGYTAGRRLFIESGTHQKECLKRDELPAYYEVSINEKCANGFQKDLSVISFYSIFKNTSCSRI